MDFLQQLYNRLFGGNPSLALTSTPRKVIAFGNVLLDHTVPLSNTELLERYNLKLNSRGEMDVETLTKLTAEALQTHQENTPEPHLGGSALNTARILKALGTDPVFFGAIGDDKYGEMVKDLLKKDGIGDSHYRLQTVADAPTGRCLCLVYKDELSLHANIGASVKFSTDYLHQIQKDEYDFFLRPIERKQIFYVEGFFLPQREEVISFILQKYIHGRRHLALNLSSDYIVNENFEQVKNLACKALFIFGNSSEFEALRNNWGVKSLDALAKDLSQGGKCKKILIVTKGADGVDMITNYIDEYTQPGSMTYESYRAPKVDNVLDTTGCGDAFAAAFLNAWLEKRQLSECIRFASDVGAKVATQFGCQLP